MFECANEIMCRRKIFLEPCGRIIIKLLLRRTLVFSVQFVNKPEVNNLHDEGRYWKQ
jgi:hypothetical protein